MKLFTEITEEVQCIVEEKDGKRNLFIQGPFIQTEKVNRNNRIYRKHIVEKEVGRYVQNYINANRALGELGHPEGPSINLDRVSHKIVSLVPEGNDYIGKAQILDTPMGNIARNLIESDVVVGVSTRGLGSIREKNGIMEVQDDFFLATAADIVADPSAPDAFVQGIMEGVEWIWENNRLKAKQLEEIRDEIKATSKRNLEEAKIKAFHSFMNLISKQH
jgi:hypothetical protein